MNSGTCIRHCALVFLYNDDTVPDNRKDGYRETALRVYAKDEISGDLDE